MQIQSIQNMFQQYGMNLENNKTQGIGSQNTYSGNSVNSTTDLSGFSFKLNIQQYSKSEFNQQGQSFKIFSLEELNISFSSSQITTSNEKAPATEYGPKNPGVGSDDYWGIGKTSERLADFVIKGGGDNLDRLKQGREGILQGLKDAEGMWGGELPEISYKTIEAALSKIDDRIHELGGSVIDTAA